MDFQEIIAGTVGKENTFGTVVGRVKPGAMSFARFSTDDTAGVIRGYVGEGAFTSDSLNTFGGVGVVQIPALAEAAALHLRERIRASRGSEFLDDRRCRARGRIALSRLADALARKLEIASPNEAAPLPDFRGWGFQFEG